MCNRDKLPLKDELLRIINIDLIIIFINVISRNMYIDKIATIYIFLTNIL